MSLPPVTSLDRLPVPAHQAVTKAAAATARKTSTADYVASQASPNAAKKPGDKEFSFWDLVDIVNPLQHIPGVNTVYRKMTGDEINGFARVAGGALFGGILGAAAGTVNAVVAMKDGKDIGDNLWAKIAGDDSETKTAAKEPLVTVTPDDKTMASAVSSTAPAPSSALFDYNLPATKEAAAEDAPKKPASDIPVIEVRPETSQETTDEKTLPPMAEVNRLNDIMPGAAGPVPSSFPAATETVTEPKDKAAIQRAMMDALIKMQEMEKDGEEQAKENASADEVSIPTN